MESSHIAIHQDDTVSADGNCKEDLQPERNKNKRKRQDDEIDNPFFRPITVSLYPQSSNRSFTFVPITHLLRADLPLIWLDHGAPLRKTLLHPGAVTNARLETVHKDALQSCNLLVARSAPNGGLYVFERAGQDAELYISFPLQPWISESRVIGQALGKTSPRDDDLKSLMGGHKTVLPTRFPPCAKSGTPKKPKDRRGALARKAILPVAAAPPSIEIPRSASPDVYEEDLTLHVATEPISIDYLRVQYLETLYTTTSLAYFAKGPLSRALKEVSQEDLLGFYQKFIISTKKLDLKYKESVDKVIDATKTLPQETEALQPLEQEASRRKNMGKDALYPAETGYIQRCWSNRDIGNMKSISIQSQAQERRKLVSSLRSRETKMQILLILEIAALQALMVKSQQIALSPATTLVKVEEQDENVATILQKKPTKTKAEPDFKSYSSGLETLIDRLCIWHTVGVDDVLGSPEDNNFQASLSRKEQLSDFCTEVIIPFYASRLPEQSKMICKKLGGPSIPRDRPMSETNKTASASRIIPGAAIQRRPRAVQRKTLERVLSDDRSMRHASPPVLARSLTAPQVPSRKREPSEQAQRPGSRSTLHKSISFTNREIDLDADARVQEVKRRKLAKVAEQKEELDAAIAALKKPNRTVAAQKLMDEIEGRSLDNRIKKQSVHITATPRRSKSKPSGRFEQILTPTAELDVQADYQMVPSSSLRPGASDQWRHPMSAKKRAVLFAMNETPVRARQGLQAALQKPVSRLYLPGTAKHGTVLPGSMLVELTPATNRLRPDLSTQIENTSVGVGKSMSPALFVQPKKGLRVEDAFRDAPIIPASAGMVMDRVMAGGEVTEMSVYDALGWNDDYEL